MREPSAGSSLRKIPFLPAYPIRLQLVGQSFSGHIPASGSCISAQGIHRSVEGFEAQSHCRPVCAHHPLHSRFFLAQDGFIAVLKKMPPPMMSPVEAGSITGQQTSHQGAHRGVSGFQQQVKKLCEAQHKKWFGISAHARQLMSLFAKMDSNRSRNRSRSLSSKKISFGAIPLTMIWCSAPGASILDFRGMTSIYHRM